MTGGDIHEISSELGYLRAEAASSRESSKAIFLKLDEITKILQGIQIQVEAHSSLLAKIEPAHNDLVRMRQRGLGILACMGVAATCIGALAAVIAQKLNWSEIFK